MSEERSFIGDYLGTIEEFIPGKGTFVEDGKIYSASIGKKVLDSKNHKASISGKLPPELEVGQVVFGDVAAFRKSMATVIVKKIQGYQNDVDIRTNILISQVSDSYVENLDEAFGIGDIVKAKVVKIEPGMIDISTKGDLGVVKAYCKRCRTPMIRSEKFQNRLECGLCGHREGRKIAKDYRNVNITDL
ncbi:exosome complex RNA-binding protein Csl4 [Candidatus Altiarchaeota archaeon]